MSAEVVQDTKDKLSVPALTAMVVGSMVGAGVFQLPARFATQTGVYGALIAWAIAGLGMLTLAFVFQTLAVRKPDLDNGVYVYARTGFGIYPGFLSAVGFWASACAGNAFYWVLIMTTLSQLFPSLAGWLGQGDTWPAFIVSVAAVWGYFLLIRRDVKEAAWINYIVTIAKLVPLALFLVLVIFFFDGEVFVGNLTGGYDVPGGASLFLQVQGTMLVTVFVFLGIEGASVYSRYAKRREDVGTATVLGFLGVLALFASISILSYGILPKAEIAALSQPSVGGVLEAAVGPWGGAFIRVGLIVSVLGAYLAWQLLAADVVFAAAKDNDMPRYFARLNSQQVPEHAVFWTSVLVSGSLRGAIRPQRPRLHARSDGGPCAGPVRTHKCLRRQDRMAAGWIWRYAAGQTRARAGDRSHLDDLHAVPHLGGGIHVRLPFLHPARPRDRALYPREAGAERQAVHDAGAHRLRPRPSLRGGRDRAARKRHRANLKFPTTVARSAMC